MLVLSVLAKHLPFAKKEARQHLPLRSYQVQQNISAEKQGIRCCCCGSHVFAKIKMNSALGKKYQTILCCNKCFGYDGAFTSPSAPGTSCKMLCCSSSKNVPNLSFPNCTTCPLRGHNDTPLCPSVLNQTGNTVSTAGLFFDEEHQKSSLFHCCLLLLHFYLAFHQLLKGKLRLLIRCCK
jgi:hypothetical protein